MSPLVLLESQPDDIRFGADVRFGSDAVGFHLFAAIEQGV